MSEHGYGGFWIRFLASLIDSLIVVTALFVLVFVGVTFLPSAMPVLTIVYTFGPLLYFVVMHASERQATYGKALLGMVVTNTDGERISFLRSLGRELGKFLSMLPLALGYVIAAFTERKQALHDFVATTTVVRHSPGRVGLGVLIGVGGWLAPIAIVFFAGAGMFMSTIQKMNSSVMESALSGIIADSTASSDSNVVQASMPTAAPDTSRSSAASSNATPSPSGAAAAVASNSRAAAPPSAPARNEANVTAPAVKTKAPAPASTTPAPQPSAVVAAAPAEVSRPPRPRPETPARALDPDAVVALDQLSPRFATEIALVPARFRDRAVQLYDFGALPRGADAPRVYWPIHGFDARGNPVAIRGQRPIFTAIPRLGAYSGLWQLVYVVTADMAQPNALSDAAAVDAAVRAKRAMLRDAGQVLNLPLVPRGTTLARDTTRALLGWYRGWEVHFFDFGAVTDEPMLGFAAARDSAGHPIVLAADSAAEVRNLQIAIVDGTPASRAASPLRTFSDMRTASPPRPTRSP